MPVKNQEATNPTPQHFYVFTYLKGIPYYERTCGTRAGAQYRVDEYREQGHKDAFYMVDCLPKKYWY